MTNAFRVHSRNIWLVITCERLNKWAGPALSNGELIKLAEADFEVFITVDKGILYQPMSH